MRSPFLTPFCYDRVSYEHTFFHHTLTLRDTSRSGRTTWGLMRRPGGSWAATACSVIANRDHKRTASRNGWVELQDKHRNPFGKMKVFTDEIIFVQKLHDSIWKILQSGPGFTVFWFSGPWVKTISLPKSHSLKQKRIFHDHLWLLFEKMY